MKSESSPGLLGSKLMFFPLESTTAKLLSLLFCRKGASKGEIKVRVLYTEIGGTEYHLLITVSV